ncbi:hypothetical protein SEVIR_9G537850v4 [Setaria viridis]
MSLHAFPPPLALISPALPRPGRVASGAPLRRPRVHGHHPVQLLDHTIDSYTEYTHRLMMICDVHRRRSTAAAVDADEIDGDGRRRASAITCVDRSPQDGRTYCVAV